MPNTKNPDAKYNDSGCKDMTAYEAVRNVQREERRSLINDIKQMARERGYKVVSTIDLEEIND